MGEKLLGVSTGRGFGVGNGLETPFSEDTLLATRIGRGFHLAVLSTAVGQTTTRGGR